MKVSVVIPAYNEAQRIGKTLPSVIEYLKKFGNKYSVSTEIIVVNDGSKDSTLEVLNKFKDSIKIINYSPNMGKGYALKQGAFIADGDFIYVADADFATPIEYIDNFFTSMEGYDCVIGSRAVGNEKVNESFVRKIMAKGSNILIRAVLGLKFKDTQCGFKMFTKKTKEYLLMCKNNRWGYDFEFLYLLQKNGLNVKEMPVKWSEVEKSKIGPLSYFRTLVELFNVRRIHK